MACPLRVYATGTTSATATLALPPGAGGSPGPQRIVVDTVDISIQSTSGTTTAGILNFNNSGGPIISSDLPTVPASSVITDHFNWPNGLAFDSDATSMTVSVNGGANATRCKIIVTYHFDFN